MASPQKENGYTPISNELLEAFLQYKFPLNTEAPRVLWLFVARKTYGYSKKNDIISLSQFQNGTNLPRNTVVHWLAYLVKALLLVRGAELLKNGYNYAINKDFEEWIPLVKALKLVKGRLFASKSPLTKTSKSPLTYINNKQTHKQGFFQDSDFTNAYNGFKEMRNKTKKPLTGRAEEMVLKKLEEYDLKTATAMLDEATEKCWRTVYPPKDFKTFGLDDLHKLLQAFKSKKQKEGVWTLYVQPSFKDYHLGKLEETINGIYVFEWEESDLVKKAILDKELHKHLT